MRPEEIRIGDRLMDEPCAKSLSALGFLTVLDAPPHGLFGGYLILNPSGRPLEFHCTAPVKANRAQEILYGPTLAPYLYAEQIGLTLVAKAQQRPPVVLTDVAPVLEMRNFLETPVALVLPDDDRLEPNSLGDGDSPRVSQPFARPAFDRCRVDGPHAGAAGLATVCLGQQWLAVAADRADDLVPLEKRLAETAHRLDLAEPFQRIREAIREAQKITTEPATQPCAAAGADSPP